MALEDVEVKVLHTCLMHLRYLMYPSIHFLSHYCTACTTEGTHTHTCFVSSFKQSRAVSSLCLNLLGVLMTQHLYWPHAIELAPNSATRATAMLASGFLV